MAGQPVRLRDLQATPEMNVALGGGGHPGTVVKAETQDAVVKAEPQAVVKADPQDDVPCPVTKGTQLLSVVV